MTVRLRPLLIGLVTAGLAVGGACAVKQKPNLASGSCSVIGGENLKAVGGSEALCEEIAQSLEAVGLAGSAKVVVNARRSHVSAQVLLADGRELSEIGFSISDRPVARSDITRFAQRIAQAVRATATAETLKPTNWSN